MSLTPQHRALIAQHGDSVADVRGRWSVDFDEYGIAAFIVAVERAARADEREACIALALTHAAGAKRTDDAASSLRLLVTKLRARAEGDGEGGR